MDFPYGYDSIAPGSAYKPGGIKSTGGLRSTTVYPSPFFDIAHTYLPSSTRELYRWCRYYALTNPLIAVATAKLASYPITEVLYETGHEGWKRRWQTMFEEYHQIRQFVVECNLDKITYGNVFVSVEFPFRKMLICPSCSNKEPADMSRYKFKNFEFYITCSKCAYTGAAKVKDEYVRSPQQIRFVRWNPENILVRYNDTTGQYFYFYDMPTYVRNDIILGRPSTVQNLQQPIIEAVKKNKAVAFLTGHLFHAKQASVSRPNADGLGIPRILPVLKETFYLQLMKKAQEAILFGYILPMRSIHPVMTGGSGGDPYSMVNLSSWKEKIRKEIERWRMDPLYVPIMPVPVGYQSLGGDGKQLNLTQEIRAWSEQIIVGMGIPIEFVFGGLSYSGSSVSLRALENEFINIREDNLSLLQFLQNKVAAFLGWEKIQLKFKPFKMADDLQRAAFDLQLAQANMLSRRTLLEQRDYDYERERDRIIEERPAVADIDRRVALSMAETQGKAQVVTSRYQAEASTIMNAANMQNQADANAAMQQQAGVQPPQQGADITQAGQPQQGPIPAVGLGGIVNVQSPMTADNIAAGMAIDVNNPQILEGWNAQLQSLPPDQQVAMLNNLKNTNPSAYSKVLYRSTKNQQTGSGQLPPRSNAANGSV